MSDPHRTYEIRCPVYGFITITDWEREIISQPWFQRLRRIRQLAGTDYVYPGATHTRFEHSLGVMHMATLLFDGIVNHSKEILKELGYIYGEPKRPRTLIRLAALLHDIGHAPFSHVAEDLFPSCCCGGRYKHEKYSAEIVRHFFADVIKNHPLNSNYGFNAEQVAGLLEGSTEAKADIFWRDLIVGQMDADRMDYLLRDSLHAGVDYGKYDWRRLVHTMQAVPPGNENENPRLGVSEGGWHAAEGLILARYFMFTQVYFHKTRVAFDHHLQRAIAEILPEKCFPYPKTKQDLEEYFKYDDWYILGLISNGKGGEHGQRILNRNHFREILHTSETPNKDELDKFYQRKDTLGNLVVAEESAEKLWYKVGTADIPVIGNDLGKETIKPLSEYSSIVAKIEPIRKIILYVRPEDQDEAKRRLTKGGE